jgi:hypothetical protein
VRHQPTGHTRIPPDDHPRTAARRAHQARRRQQRHRLLALALVLVVGGLITMDLLRDPDARRPWRTGQPDQASAPTSAGPAGVGTASQIRQQPKGVQSTMGAGSRGRISVVQKGPGTFGYAAGTGRVLGRAGPLERFTVAVEKGVGVTPGEFAGRVESILGDDRSWIGGGNVRFQRIAGAAGGADFTVYLATPVTSEQMCREDGLSTERFTSCRLASGKVVINLARWLTAIPNYGAPLETYQAYAIDHEVGHQLGHGHEACPGAGQLAPVMQQQTLGLRRCVANPWPFVDGTRYAGPQVP